MKVNALLTLGEGGMFPEEYASEDELLRAMDESDIAIALVQPVHTNTSFDRLRLQHDALADLARRQSGSGRRIVGLTAMNPHFEEDIYRSEVGRCIGELGFAGILVSPQTYAFNPRCARGHLPWDLAREHAVPLIAHTGTVHSWTEPTRFCSQLEKYPDVRFLIARGGVPACEVETRFLLRSYPNVSVLASSSSLTAPALRRYLDEFGAGRVVFGSTNVADIGDLDRIYAEAGLSAAEEKAVMHENACRLFGLAA